MAGHLGNVRSTQQNLEVISTDLDRGLILVKGSVPGAAGGYILVSDAVKHAIPESAPLPAAVRSGKLSDYEDGIKDRVFDEKPITEANSTEESQEEKLTNNPPAEEELTGDAKADEKD